MIRARSLTLARGSRVLIRDAHFDLPPGARVGVVGRNGTGKSSLFAALQGGLAAEGGELVVPGHWVRASVAQHMPQGADSALAYALAGDEELAELRRRYRLAEQQDDGVEIAQLGVALDHAGNWDAEARTAQLLRGLGFAEGDLKRAVDEFSGGWRMRLALARTLMCRSDLLLLDEPTNHLDLDTVLWLEGWLKRYRGTLLAISHDRDFLDAVCTHTLYLDGETAQLYAGAFSAFARQRVAHIEQARREAAQVAARRAHLQRFVDRFKAKASKARQAQSRVKALEKLSAAPVPAEESEVHWVVPAPAKLPDPLLSLAGVSAGYGERRVLDGVSLYLEPGDRVGLLGRNGAGKSTLMKLLAGVLEPFAGERKPARDLAIGYFAQSQVEELLADATPLQLLLEGTRARGHEGVQGSGYSEQQARDYLGGFGYGGEMATQAVGPRSGGEKARLALALLLVHKPNLLLLDEPTNHLDMAARAALVEALQDYPGAVVLVSHDRALLESCCERYLRVHTGAVGDFDEDLDAYARLLRGEGTASTNPVIANVVVKAGGGDHKERRALGNRLKRLEEQVEKLTLAERAAEQALADAATHQGSNALELVRLEQARADAAAAREQSELEWLDLAEKIEAM
ncbi:MAG: ATP-binding cassette domain-containing protein [Xanthomonadales bacterium]|nr:putative ABC transporter ATP-binding protein YheS [Xanthomonadales bacterium]MCC6593562.1 ATP-binding cassette domain-containing protein [Xanthomonadales bacterium]MCE7932286.1 ATP-binding cassette domain-containing protein [Xanthomonadales bacterium PRO6]